MKYDVLTIKCPLCDFTTKHEKRFNIHLFESHQITDTQQFYDEHILKSSRPQCACGCGQHQKWYGMKKGYASKFVMGHNARIYTSFTNKTTIEKMKLTRADGLKSGRIKIWNAGLTKETDERLVKRSQKIIKKTSSSPNSNKIKKVKSTIQLNGNKDYVYNEHQKYNQICDICDVLEFNTEYEKKTAQYDIIIPKQKFAINCIDLYEDSETNISDANHFSTKSKLANLEDIKLFHIFSDEWRDKREIVTGMIVSRLGLCSNKLMARKLTLKQLIPSERRKFFDENHIDGDVGAKVSWGLFNNEELVSAISLRTPFHKTDGTIELARFASKCQTVVSGALGKLLSKAMEWAKENNYTNIKTYVDTRLGDGHSYEKVGFQFKKLTANRFWWTDYQNRFDRFKFKADSKLGLTERQIANNAGVVRIYGCPNKVYEINV